jgi:hypothetical protein
VPRTGKFRIHIAQLVFSSKVTGRCPLVLVPAVFVVEFVDTGFRPFFREIELEVDLDDELDPVELELELLEPEPDSDPLDSDPDSLDLEARRLEGLGCVANLEVVLRLPAEPLPPPNFAVLCPLSLLLLVLLHVESGLTAPLSLFRYTLEDLTCNRSELEAMPPTVVPVLVLRGDNGVSFQLIKFEPPRLFRPPLLLLELELLVLLV